MLVAALEATHAALERDDAPAALEAIVAAWRIQHHPRIGALAARISPLAADGRPPIGGTTPRMRLAAWLEAETKHDLVDVEVLLAEPWPKQWRDGYARFLRIAEWEPDPRVAAFLAQAFVVPPYRSQASVGLQLLLLRHLIALEDPRSRDIVERTVRQLATSHDEARTMHGRLHETLAVLAQIATLAPRAESRIARLEARFAGDIRDATLTQQTQADFLARIDADPGDLATKVVFADWLTARGHPRGELITLGIARRDGTASPEAARRERELVQATSVDPTAWDWPIAMHFARGSHRYEDGFFAGGRLACAVEPSTMSTGWSHVRFIEVCEMPPYEPTAIELLGRLTDLRELANVDVRDAMALLAAGLLERIELLEVVEDGRTNLLDMLAQTTGLPSLKTFGVVCARWGETALAALPSWPIVRRVERILLRGTEERLDVPAILEALASVPGPTTVEVRPRADVVYRVERTGTGPFRRLTMRGSTLDVVTTIDAFPAGSLEAITVEGNRSTLPVEVRTRLFEAFARFPDAALDVPFERPVSTTTPEPVALVSVRITGSSFHRPDRIGELMRHAERLGIHFDFYTPGWGNLRRGLTPEPIAKAEALAKVGKQMTLYADGTGSRAHLHARDDDWLELEVTQVAGLLDWIAALVEERLDEVRTLSVEIEPRPRRFVETPEMEDPHRLWPRSTTCAVLLDEAWSRRLAPDRWTRHRAAERDLAGLAFRPVGSRLLVALHADPIGPPTPRERAAFARVVTRILAEGDA